MSREASNCCHVIIVEDVTWEQIKKLKEKNACDSCGVGGPNLWMCLYSSCSYTGCSEQAADHSSQHTSQNPEHCLSLNLTSLRIWCDRCDSEVYKDNNNPPLFIRERPYVASSQNDNSAANFNRLSQTHHHDDSSDSASDEEGTLKPRGLTGLQNIGNTCYMNSALQALSNCPPLTRFFLDCSSYVGYGRKSTLSLSYLRLISDMWHKSRPGYVTPSRVAQVIKMVQPLFRGSTQQDTQEFLRCFMDQLHEELKSPVIDIFDVPEEDHVSKFDNDSCNEFDVRNLTDDQRLTSNISNAKQKGLPQPDAEASQSSRSPTIPQSSTPVHSPKTVPKQNSASLANNPSADNSRVVQSAKDSTVNSIGSGSLADENSRGDSVLEADSKSDDRSGAEDTFNNRLTTDEAQANNSFGSNWYSVNREMSDHESTETLIGEDQNQQDADDSTSTNLPPVQCVNRSTPFTDETSDSTLRHRHRTNTESETTARPQRFRSSASMSKSNSEEKSTKSTEYSSIVSDVFDGKLLSSVQCLSCETISSTKETFQDLSLPIPSKDQLHFLHSNFGSKAGNCGKVALKQGWSSWLFSWFFGWFWGPSVRLQDCLAAFFSADELKGDNMYSCEKCKKLRNGVKYSRVIKLPEILSIHLKRFRHEFMFSTKISHYISFPMDGLDMSPYLHKDCHDQVSTYDLVGVICHHGTAGGGHYTAYAQNYINTQWYEFDDQCVTQVDLQQVENCNAYVLFYRKTNDHMFQLRQKCQNLIENPENSIMKFYISKQWINKFNTFAEPGSITNCDFLCQHGGVAPTKWKNIHELVQEVPQPMWEFLHERFGGGPAINHLYLCSSCQQELDMIEKRQRWELHEFIKLKEIFDLEEGNARIFSISMVWFKLWENFVMMKTTDIPPPINNKNIMYIRNNQAHVRLNADYGQLSETMWRFLFDIYGGGPELPLTQQNIPTPITSHAPTQPNANTPNNTHTPNTNTPTATQSSAHPNTNSAVTTQSLNE